MTRRFGSTSQRTAQANRRGRQPPATIGKGIWGDAVYEFSGNSSIRSQWKGAGPSVKRMSTAGRPLAHFTLRQNPSNFPLFPPLAHDLLTCSPFGNTPRRAGFHADVSCQWFVVSCHRGRSPSTTIDNGQPTTDRSTCSLARHLATARGAAYPTCSSSNAVEGGRNVERVETARSESVVCNAQGRYAASPPGSLPS
jgi:hypothetical protein